MENPVKDMEDKQDAHHEHDTQPPPPPDFTNACPLGPLTAGLEMAGAPAPVEAALGLVFKRWRIIWLTEFS